MGAQYSRKNDVTIATMDCLKFLATIKDGEAALVVTSPPFNIGKIYESKMSVADYTKLMQDVIAECVRIVRPGGSICWDLGMSLIGRDRFTSLLLLLGPCFERYADDGVLRYRNTIIWYFGHGLHPKRRFSGRHQPIVWYSKGDDYTFNLDAVRIPQKYPGKRHHKGDRKGEYSGNPRGKNPGDVWFDIPNVKANHVEKTLHPCQFPVGLPKRLIQALTNPGDLVVDPFVGVGTTLVAALQSGRRSAGVDRERKYVATARRRLRSAFAGTLRTRDDKPVYEPKTNTPLTRVPEYFSYATAGADTQD